MDRSERRAGRMIYDWIRFCVLFVINGLQGRFVYFVCNRIQNRMLGSNIRNIRFTFRLNRMFRSGENLMAKKQEGTMA